MIYIKFSGPTWNSTSLGPVLGVLAQLHSKAKILVYWAKPDQLSYLWIMTKKILKNYIFLQYIVKKYLKLSHLNFNFNELWVSAEPKNRELG